MNRTNKLTSLLFKARSILVLVLGCAPAGCDSASSSNKSGTLHYDLEVPEREPEGPVYEDADFTLRSDVPEPCPAAGVLAPQPGWSRLAIPVTVSVRADRPVPSGPMLFSVVMDGRVYRPTLAGCKAPFATRQLDPGKTMQAHVIFDLPLLKPPLKLLFEPYIVGRKPVKAQVLVPLGPYSESHPR